MYTTDSKLITRFQSLTEAQAVARSCAGDDENWTYVAVTDRDNRYYHAVVAVFDEDREFLGYL